MKNIKVILKEILLLICCSYAVVVAVNVFFASEAYMMSINAHDLRLAFWLCVVTSVILEILTSISYAKEWMFYACTISGMYISVFGVGSFILGLIPVRISVYVSVSIMSLLIYLVCTILMYAIQKGAADEINEKIRKKITYHKEQQDE